MIVLFRLSDWLIYSVIRDAKPEKNYLFTIMHNTKSKIVNRKLLAKQPALMFFDS